MPEYRITSHAHLSGVRLSKLGHWANMPFETEAAAQLAAKDDAKGAPFTVERKDYPALPMFGAKR